MQEDITNSSNGTVRHVLSGQWLYDDTAFLPVQIFVLSFDYYYEIAKVDNQLEFGEKPELNESGEQYMIVWNSGSFDAPGTKDYGGLTLQEAVGAAEAILGKGIQWKQSL